MGKPFPVGVASDAASRGCVGKLFLVVMALDEIKGFEYTPFPAAHVKRGCVGKSFPVDVAPDKRGCVGKGFPVVGVVTLPVAKLFITGCTGKADFIELINSMGVVFDCLGVVFNCSDVVLDCLGVVFSMPETCGDTTDCCNF